MGSKVTSLLKVNRGSNYDSLKVGYLTLFLQERKNKLQIETPK